MQHTIAMGATEYKATVLVAEDSEDDLFLLTRAFRRAGLTHCLVPVADGEKAIEYLQGQSPAPDLLLLDLKMPKVDGFGVLEWLQHRPELRMPAIVYSTSEEPEDKQRAKQLGAADYLVKTADFQSLVVDLDTRFLSKT
jgi:CheY-like chemotaxis protein